MFACRYVTGGGKHTRVIRQTVIYFRSPQLHLPEFALRPENLFHKMGAAFGYQDIDFDSHRKFVKIAETTNRRFARSLPTNF